MLVRASHQIQRKGYVPPESGIKRSTTYLSCDQSKHWYRDWIDCFQKVTRMRKESQKNQKIAEIGEQEHKHTINVQLRLGKRKEYSDSERE